jgi:photosystem II stability/assembly factor-like uncharacterized protein
MGDSVIFNENLMMKISLLILVFLCIGCQNNATEKVQKSEADVVARNFTQVELEILLKDSISVRAIEVTKDALLFAGDKGNYGSMSLETQLWKRDSQSFDRMVTDSVEGEEKMVSTPMAFRSVASNKDFYFILSIGSPAQLFRINKVSGAKEIVFTDTDPKAFYDSMDFWNENEGIAMGDPINDCLSVIVTRDGGSTWQKISCDVMPRVTEGEAAFAASDTNIKIIGDETWIVSGGKQSRVFHSPNKGIEWEVITTPVTQGEPTQGAYTMDFYDQNQGIVYGGDYLKPAENTNNIAITSDGGKTWNPIGSGANDGYKSCVQYVPNRGGNEIVAVGFTGISYSKDGGAHWTELSKESFLSFRFLNDSIAYAGGRNRIAKLTFR